MMMDKYLLPGVLSVIASIVSGVVLIYLKNLIFGRPGSSDGHGNKDSRALGRWYDAKQWLVNTLLVFFLAFVFFQAFGNVSLNRETSTESLLHVDETGAREFGGVPAGSEAFKSDVIVEEKPKASRGRLREGENAPVVVIKHPTEMATVDVFIDRNSGSAMFYASGTTEHVVSENALYLHILVHPEVIPPANGWWLSSAQSMDADGNWRAEIWYGDKAHLPPKTGQKIQLVAVVLDDPNLTDANYGKVVSDIRSLNPLAMSELVTVDIGELSAR